MTDSKSFERNSRANIDENLYVDVSISVIKLITNNNSNDQQLNRILVESQRRILIENQDSHVSIFVFKRFLRFLSCVNFCITNNNRNDQQLDRILKESRERKIVDTPYVDVSISVVKIDHEQDSRKAMTNKSIEFGKMAKNVHQLIQGPARCARPLHARGNFENKTVQKSPLRSSICIVESRKDKR